MGSIAAYCQGARECRAGLNDVSRNLTALMANQQNTYSSGKGLELAAPLMVLFGMQQVGGGATLTASVPGHLENQSVRNTPY